MQTSDRLSSSTAPHHATRKHMRLMQRNYPFYFVAGALLLYVVFFLIPALMGFYYAFTDWNSYSTDVNFVGLDNFRVIFSSHENYLSYVKNTLIFAIVTIILKTVLGLLLALLLNGGLAKFKQLHRTLIYLPAVLPMLVVGLVFKSILNPGDRACSTAGCARLGWARSLNAGSSMCIWRCRRLSPWIPGRAWATSWSSCSRVSRAYPIPCALFVQVAGGGRHVPDRRRRRPVDHRDRRVRHGRSIRAHAVAPHLCGAVHRSGRLDSTGR